MRPENTLAAFENALSLGCDSAELDVHLTKDGKLVVHHNSSLNYHFCRKNNGEWITQKEELAICDLTYQELLQYQVGMPNPDTDYHKRFPQLLPTEGQRIPLLSEVIQLVKESSEVFHLIIELKTPVLDAACKPWRRLVEATLKILRKENFADRCILCSFDWGALVYAKSLNRDVRTWFTTHPLSWLGNGVPPNEDIPPSAAYLEKLRGLLASGAPWYAEFDPREFNGDYARAISTAGGDGWFMYHTDCTPEKMKQLNALNVVGAVWSVNLNDPTANERLMSYGVDAICTDYPTDRTIYQR